MSNALIPPDKKRCQAMKSKAVSFMSFGNPPLERCENVPSVIAKETKPGQDGKKGSMSLCESCLKVALEQLGKDYFTTSKIKKTIPKTIAYAVLHKQTNTIYLDRIEGKEEFLRSKILEEYGKAKTEKLFEFVKVKIEVCK